MTTLLHPVTGQERVWVGPELRARETTRTAGPSVPTTLPIELQRILRPQAAANWLSATLSSMTPQRIEGILRGAMGGDHLQQWELFDLMEDTWPRLLKNLGEVKRAVKKLDWKLLPWAEEETAPSASADEKAKLISRAIWSMKPEADLADNAFEDTIFDILDAWGKGVSVLEIEWRQDRESNWVPKSTSWVHPCNYGWGEDGRLGLVIQENQSQNRNGLTNFLSAAILGGAGARRQTTVPFPEHKFLIAVARAKTGHPSAAALLRPLAWWWCAANFSAEWLLNLAQIFGLPIRWATYDPAQPGLLEKLCDMLENMGSTAWGAFPSGTSLELKDGAKSGGGSDTPQADMLDRADRQCDLLILGQTLTSDVGAGGSGSRALGQVHETVREDVIEAAADFAARVINSQLIPAILQLNYGDDDEAPEFCPERKRVEDAKANAERDQILANMGLKIPAPFLYKRHNVPMPQPNEETVGGASPAAQDLNADSGDDADGGAEKPKEKAEMKAANFERQGLALALRARELKAQEKLADHILESLTGIEGRWLGGVKPIFMRLLRDVENAREEDLEAVLLKAAQKLPEVGFERINSAALAEALEEAMGASCINGAVSGALKRKARR